MAASAPCRSRHRLVLTRGLNETELRVTSALLASARELASPVSLVCKSFLLQSGCLQPDLRSREAPISHSVPWQFCTTVSV